MAVSVNSSLRGKAWRLPNGYWRGCNATGQQCTFRLQVEAQRFAAKVLPSKHPKTIRATVHKTFVL